MIISRMPVNVMADTMNNKFRNTYVEPQFENKDNEQGELESKIIKETVEKRESNIKHFLKEDNTYEAVIYNEPVHYLENGRWKDIDNSFSEIEDKKEYTYIEKENNEESDKYTNNGMHEKKQKTENSSDIKNNNQLSHKEFKFRIKASNLIPKIENDNRISFYSKDDGKKKIFDMDAPFMIDANNAISDDIKVELIKDGDEYILLLRPDTKWLNSIERKYPVKIDPTENSSLGINDIEDAYVHSSEPNKNRQMDPFVTVGYGSSTKVSRGFIKFNKLPKLSSSEMVVKATIDLTLGFPNRNGKVNQVNIYEVKKINMFHIDQLQI